MGQIADPRHALLDHRAAVFDLLLVSVSPHFAPGETIYVDGDTDNSAAGETCTIQYRVIDPSTTATSGTLEILRTRNNRVLHRVDLTAAQYRDGRHTFEWDGRQWAGPSDTGNRKGDPLPAGDYTLEVSAVGSTRVGVDGPETPFRLAATARIRLIE